MIVKIDKKEVSRNNFNAVINGLSLNHIRLLLWLWDLDREERTRVGLFGEEEELVLSDLSGSRHLVLDLGHVCFMDSYGVMGMSMIVRHLEAFCLNYCSITPPFGLILPRSEEAVLFRSKKSTVGQENY